MNTPAALISLLVFASGANMVEHVSPARHLLGDLDLTGGLPVWKGTEADAVALCNALEPVIAQGVYQDAIVAHGLRQSLEAKLGRRVPPTFGIFPL